jgi:hypothetical protein
MLIPQLEFLKQYRTEWNVKQRVQHTQSEEISWLTKLFRHVMIALAVASAPRSALTTGKWLMMAWQALSTRLSKRSVATRKRRTPAPPPASRSKKHRQDSSSHPLCGFLPSRSPYGACWLLIFYILYHHYGYRFSLFVNVIHTSRFVGLKIN